MSDDGGQWPDSRLGIEDSTQVRSTSDQNTAVPGAGVDRTGGLPLLGPQGGARRRRTRRDLTGVLFATPALLLFLVFVAWPLSRTIVLSLQRWNGFDAPAWAGLDNYSRLLRDPGFWSALTHTLVYAVGTTVGKVGLGLGLALLLDASLRGRSFYRSVIFAPALMSFVAVGLLWQLIYAPSIGLADQLLGVLHIGGQSNDWLGSPVRALFAVMVVDVWKWAGYHAVLFSAGLSLISTDLRDAARVDGADWFQEFWHVTLPSLRGLVVLNVIFAVAGAFNTFDLVYVMTDGGPYGGTDLLMTFLYRQAFTNSQYGYASAVACLLLLVVGMITILLLRAARSDYDAA